MGSVYCDGLYMLSPGSGTIGSCGPVGARCGLVGVGVSLWAIALCVGYDNPSKFASAFKKVMGSTPLKYRNNF